MDTLDEVGIKLHPDFVKDIKVRKAHIKNDIYVCADNLISELSQVGHTGRYNKVLRENSITYECTNISERTSLRAYGKLEEMLRNKTKYKGLEIDINQFQGLTRIESHFNDSRSIRKHLNTRDFWKILHLTNVNYIIMSNILKDQKLDIPQVDIDHLKTMTELNDFARVFLLNHICKGNSIAIKKEIKQRVKHPKYQYKKLNKYLPLIKNPKGKKMTAILETKRQLKEA